MGTLSGNATVIQNDDLVCIADRTDALRDDDLGGVGTLVVQSLAEQAVCPVVQRGEGIVKNEYLRFSCNGSCNGKPLFLPAGEVASALCDVGLVSPVFFFYKIRCLSYGNGGFDILVGNRSVSVIAISDVGRNVTGKQDYFLGDVTDLVPQISLTVVLYIEPVYENGAVCGIVKTGDQVDYRTFSAAGGADKGNGLAFFCFKADVFYNIGCRIWIAEGNILKLDLAAERMLCRLGGKIDCRTGV